MTLSKTYPAAPQSVAAVRAEIGALAREAGAPAAMVAAIGLAVSEAATNVVVHAYGASTDSGAIHVEGTVDAGELRVTVADDGSGLQPRPHSPGLGLGLAVISQLADKVDLRRGSNGGLRVVMRFSIRSP